MIFMKSYSSIQTVKNKYSGITAINLLKLTTKISQFRRIINKKKQPCTRNNLVQGCFKSLTEG